MLIINKKMGIGDRLLIQDSFNLNTMSGLVKFVKNVLFGTFIIEGLGAALYMLVFVPQFGARGIWISVFTSVSAFCNAGIDIIKLNSLCDYASHPVINGVTCALIVLGGLGYVVWWDVARVLRERKQKKSGCWRRLTLHSKIAITATVGLIVTGAVLFFLFERDNPATMGNMSLFGKIQTSVFQSVTTRTAGFFTVPQEGLTNASSIVSLLLMFIGGSPVGTAGGIKTVTFVVLFAAAYSAIKQRDDVTLLHRTLSKQAVSKATGVLCMSFSIMFLSTVLLAAVTDASSMDIVYETVSATATVGLSRNLTPSLNTAGKLIVAATMYLGRVGPISLAIAFNLKKQRQNIVKNPVEDIHVG
jgi:trk system potassium uptake protein TrkH